MGGMIAKRFENERCDILATLSRDSIVHETVSCGQPVVRRASARAGICKDV